MNLQQLLDQYQTDRQQREPLAAHTLSQRELDTHTRENYALLLAAILRTRNSIHQDQSQLFAMLLNALGLPEQHANLLQRAQNLEPADLTEIRRLLIEHKLGASLLMDGLVLLRLAAPFTEDELQLVSELAAMLDTPSAQLSALAQLAAHTLGIEILTQLPEDIDVDEHPHWLEFIFQPFDAQQLVNGLSPGLWRLDHDLDMQQAWSMGNLQLIFLNQAQLNTSAQGSISLDKVSLINPRMHFNDALSVTMHEVRVEGDYPSEGLHTALTFTNLNQLNINNSRFSTPGARCLHLCFTPLEINHSRFEYCGNSQMVGGALAFSEGASAAALKISNTEFIACISNLGGAIRTGNLQSKSIKGCTFSDCTSLGLTNNLRDIAVFSGSAKSGAAADCIFRNCSIFLGYLGFRAEKSTSSFELFNGTIAWLKDNIYQQSSDYKVTENSKFYGQGNKSAPYELSEFTYENWMNQY